MTRETPLYSKEFKRERRELPKLTTVALLLAFISSTAEIIRRMSVGDANKPMTDTATEAIDKKQLRQAKKTDRGCKKKYLMNSSP